MAMLMTYLVARYWGSFLPFLAELGVAPDARAGMRTALLYLANILGAAAGSIVTGFVLMDVLTLSGIAGWLVAIGLACAILLFTVLPVARQRKHTLAVAAAGFGLVALLATPVVNADILEHLQPRGVDRHPLVKVVENRSGIITVDRTGTVFGNGMYDGRFTTDLVRDTNGIVRPYALSLFHPAPRDVLMIGLSSGSWAQVIANNPAVASLTIVEINPGYVQLVAQAHDRDGRRPPLAAPHRPPFRRDRLQHDLALPRQRHQPGVARVPRPGEGAPQPGRGVLLQHHRLGSRAAHRL
jgi:predicted membrane-bound spermidine synthase